MRKHRFYISFILLLFGSLNTNAQPNWHYTVTGTNHTILIQNTIPITIDGSSMDVGDYLGVFYDSLGTLACGGYMEWTGTTSTLAAWGAQQGNTDGFANGESFVWKIWQSTSGLETIAEVSYLTGMFPHQGSFVANGMSGLASLLAITPELPSPNWYFETTAIKHQIVVPQSTSILFNNSPIDLGDYLGVFYDSLGVLACGGYLSWNNQPDTLTIYGKESTENGFEIGEELTWMIWKASSGLTGQASATYNTQTFPDSCFFKTGGLSQTANLWAISGSDLALESLVWPQSSCNLLGISEDLAIVFTNNGNTTFFGINLSVSIPEIGFDSVLYIPLTIPLDSSIEMSFPLSLDLSDNGTYTIDLHLVQNNDVITSNDTLSETIAHYALPVVSILNLDSAYCKTSNQQIELVGHPQGGHFSGQGVLNGYYYPAIVGSDSVQYTYTDPVSGCTNTHTTTLEVLARPTVELGPDRHACEGDTLILNAPMGHPNYYWSHSLGNTNSATITQSGLYSVTVVSSNLCEGTDEVELNFHPLPQVTIVGDSSACKGDSILLDAGTGFDFYAWHTDPPTFAQQIYVSTTGFYTLDVSLNNCTASDSIYTHFLPLPALELSGQDSACMGDVVVLDAGPGYSFYQWSNSFNNWGQTNTIYQAGLYAVTVTGENNCRNSDTIDVHFFPFPKIEFEPVPFLCKGDTVLLSPGKADAYLWNTGETSNEISVTQSHLYSVTLTSNQCSSQRAINLFFFEQPKLDFSFEKEFHRVQFINQSTLETNYRWFFGDGHSSRDFEPYHEYPCTGKYLVGIESINDCGYSYYADTIAITDVDWGFSFKRPSYYPNPGSGLFTISFSLYEEIEFSYRLINSQGITLLHSPVNTFPVGENKIRLNLTDFEEGIYFIEWTSEWGSFTDKLILVR